MNSGKAANNLRLCPPGTPDLLAVGRLASFWIEVKTPTGKLRPEQEQMIEELRKRGQFVLVARGLEDVENIGAVGPAL
jgi:tRNA G18 (ribose-2'-O)-methylase SpoU